MRFGVFENLLLLSLLAAVSGNRTCKCFVGDACWPSQQEWDAFNTTVGGRLIKTIPLASPCHDPNYDESLCSELASEWKHSIIHINSSSSVQAPIFANASCDPYTSERSHCLFGNYVRYAVKVAGPDDIAATIRFADEHNIRLVIRNTGHDYMGRSTGAGGLAIWTHFLQDVEIKDWSDDEYTGKAIRIGAGVEGSKALDAAAAAGLVAVTGECPTVGLAGGYVQNGGHSPLSTALGLGADQTLEFEVMTADGELVTASPFNNHSDLFWSLSGSGAGNYGVVVSVSLKVHADATTSGAAFVIEEPGLDYAAILDVWHAALPRILEVGTMATYYATNASMTLYSLTGYNRSKADLASALAPVLSSFSCMNVTVKTNYTSFNSYHDHYSYYYGPLPAGHFGGAGDSLIGGRFLLRDALPNVGPAINASTLQTGGTFIGQATNVSRFESSARAVMPQWRHAAVMSSYSLPYSFDVPFPEMKAQQDRITNEIMPQIEAVTPRAGAYINEADYQQDDWQHVFFGSNYDDLLAVKRKYDPKGLFWNAIAVGSERWEILSDGRMCETSRSDLGNL